jgi:hypothetical protein
LRLGFNAIPFGATQIVFFDLLNGVISSNPNALAASITDAGNGWWRLAVTATATSTASDLISIRLSENGTVSNYTGTGTNGIYIWGAQLETGTYAGDYAKTEGSAASTARTAAYLPDGNGNFVSAGELLLEGAGTNLLLRSEEFETTWLIMARLTSLTNAGSSPITQVPLIALLKVVPTNQATTRFKELKQGVSITSGTTSTFTHC